MDHFIIVFKTQSRFYLRRLGPYNLIDITRMIVNHTHSYLISGFTDQQYGIAETESTLYLPNTRGEEALSAFHKGLFPLPDRLRFHLLETW